MKHFFYFLLIIVPNLAFAQISVKGNVLDSTQKPLASATVMLFDAKDSSLVRLVRTLDGGNFEFKNLRTKPYFVKITFVGLQVFQKTLANADGLVDLGNILLLPVPKQLNEVVIRGERAPITIKKDTVEYNAGSFKTQANAVVEDLLRKLPGIEVERDGTIKAMGQKVERVLVDGKEFFGKDPKMASKNLPADAVDKVQVFDRKSDAADFTGIDDGNRAKTINIALKEDHKKMTFGALAAGAGPDGRFSTRANLNRFNKARQLSFIGLGNNVNQLGFSIGDYLNFSGDLQRIRNGGGGQIRLNFSDDDGAVPFNTGLRQNGFLTNWAAGLNFNDQLNEKSEVNGSYFLNSLNQQTERELNRENILPNGSLFSKQNAFQANRSTNQRLNFTVDTKIDSANSLKWTNYVNYAETSTFTNSNGQSLNQNSELLNGGTRQNLTAGNSVGLSSNLLWRHKFSKKGRSLTANLALDLNNDDKTGNLNATNYFYTGKAISKIDTIAQSNTQKGRRGNYGLTLTYTEPIAKRKYLELNYAFQGNRSEVLRDVFDLKRSERIFNPNLSNNFQTDFSYHRAGLNFRAVQKRYNFSTGIAVQESSLDGTLPLKNIDISRRFTNFLPNVRFNYDIAQSKRLGLNYDTNVQQPNINQLAPVVDNSDPLNVYVGNEALRPEYSHAVRLNYNSFNAFDFRSLFVYIDARYTTNKIKDAQNTDEKGRRTVQPVNVANDLSLTANASVGFRIKPLRSRVNFSPSANYARGLGVINNVTNTTQTRILRANLKVEFLPKNEKWKDKFELSLGADVSHNQTLYSLSGAFNQAYFNQTYTGEAIINLPKNWNARTDMNYLIYNFGGSGFEQRLPLWNASVSKLFLKNNRGELKLSVVDILNQNIGIQRVAQQNFIQDERIRSLARYFLLTFTYNLKYGAAPSSGGLKIMTQ